MNISLLSTRLSQFTENSVFLKINRNYGEIIYKWLIDMI